MEERETEWLISGEKWQVQKDKGSEEWADVGGLFATQVHGEVWA